jgi:hypothetical protein
MATVELTAENFEPVVDGGGLVLVGFLGRVVRLVPHVRARV